MGYVLGDLVFLLVLVDLFVFVVVFLFLVLVVYWEFLKLSHKAKVTYSIF